MSLYALFDIGKSGIAANQRALAVASNNIANVNTPGYSRQEVVIKVANPIELDGNFIGRGVGETYIRRSFDNFNFLQILGQSSSYGNAYALENGLSHVEQIFNEAKEMGLSKFLEGYFNAWQDVSDSPDNPAARTSLLREAEALVNASKQVENDLRNTIEYINNEISDVVNEINTLANQIAVANGKVQQVEAGGTEAATTFRDERERLMKELAKLVEYDWNEDADGSVTIVAARRSLVAGVEAFDLSTTTELNGDTDVYSSATNITDFIQKGELGGHISLRDDLNQTTLVGVRKLVASITQETNKLHDDGYGLDNSTGNDFFNELEVNWRNDTDGTSLLAVAAGGITVTVMDDNDPLVPDENKLSLTEYDIVFSNATDYQVINHATGEVYSNGIYNPAAPTAISLNGEMDVTLSGTAASGAIIHVSPLMNAVSNFGVNISDPDEIAVSDATTLNGANRANNENANAIIGVIQANVANLDGVTFNDYYGGIVSNVASLSKSASDNLEFDDNLLYELENKRESISGVSLDEEAASLIRFQRAYEAGARIIQITDELLEMVINL